MIQFAQLDSGSLTLIDFVVELIVDVSSSFFEFSFCLFIDNSSLVSWFEVLDDNSVVDKPLAEFFIP